MIFRSELHMHSMDHIQTHPRLRDRLRLKGPKRCHMRTMGECDTHRINASVEGKKMRVYRYTLPLFGSGESFVGYSITFEHLKLYSILIQRVTSKRQHGLRSKYIISIQDILEHLKSKDTCIIAMMRQSSTSK